MFGLKRQICLFLMVCTALTVCPAWAIVQNQDLPSVEITNPAGVGVGNAVEPNDLSATTGWLLAVSLAVMALAGVNSRKRRRQPEPDEHLG